MQDVILLTGAGQISAAIAIEEEAGSHVKIVVSDKNINNAQT